MAKIRKINVSEIEGRSPFNQDDEAIMPSGTVVVYEKDNNGVIEYVLRVHDGITNGGVALGAGPTPAIFNGSDGIIASNLNEGIAAVFNNGDVYITGGESVRFTGIGEFEGFSVPVLRFWNAEGRHSTNNDTTELVELRVGNDADEGDPTEGFFKIRTEKQDEPENEKEWKFDANGILTLPVGGTITEGVVTNNPTIQLTPATPTVASQKLVIKGGAQFSAEDNGIFLTWNEINPQVSDTVTIFVGANAYTSQTLYWWITPAEAGIADPGSGTIEIDGSGNGSFTFTVDSDDYEFTVRVSPENNNYDPDSIGVETQLFNADAPAFSDYHLHLTTGDLAETSIFLGTDNHNVRTTVDGGVEINTFLYPEGGGSAKWTFDNNGDLTFPGSSNARIGESEPGLVVFSDFGFAVVTNADSISTYEVEFIGFVSDGLGNGSPGATLTVTEIVAGTITNGMTIYGAGLPEEGWAVTFDSNLLPPVGSGGTGNYLLDGANILTSSQSFNNNVLAAGSQSWVFGNDGNITLPNNGMIRTDGDNVEVGNLNNFNVEAAGVVNIYTDTEGTGYQWQFGDNGDLTVPGGIVAEYQEDFTITTSYLGMSSPPGPVDRTFTFTANGNLTFPDGTTQTSAYIPTITTGNSVVASPGGIGRNGMSIWLTNAGQVQMSFDSNINVKGRYTINGGATTVIDPPNGATQIDTRYNIGTALNLDDHLTATIVDSSFHNVYRLTVIVRQKDTTPGSEFTTAYVIIEELQ